MTRSIRLAKRTEKDMAALASLWKDTFGDTDEFINGFIADYLIPEYNVPVVCVGDEIASAFYMLEFPLYSQTRTAGLAAYLFAAATDNKYRNRGYMGELIEYALELYKNRGFAAVFLMPAQESLFDYYKRFGFLTVYGAAEAEFSGKDLKPNGYDLIQSGTEFFPRLYEAYASSAIKYPLSPLKDEKFYNYAAKSYINDAGKSFFGRITSGGKVFCYIFYTIRENSVSVDDITVEEEFDGLDWNEICGTVASSLGFDGKILVTAPEFDGAHKTPRAMLRPLNGETEDICGKILSAESKNYINMFINY